MSQFSNIYDYISIQEASRIKNILLTAELIEPIHLEIGDMVFHATSITNPYEPDFSSMERTDFLGDHDERVLIVGPKRYPFFYMVGDWGYMYRFPGYHVCLGTSKFHDFFAQMDISQCVKDENNIYFVKNISKLAGHGAIYRLNSGLGKDRRGKLLRREQLVKELSAQVIDFEDQRWLCFWNIPIASLYDENAESSLLHGFLASFIKYALTIEQIINTSVD